MVLGFCIPVAPSVAGDTCRQVLDARVRQCAADCVQRARAAVDPEVRGRILGYGCVSNCAKLEMFAGHACPAPH